MRLNMEMLERIKGISGGAIQWVFVRESQPLHSSAQIGRVAEHMSYALAQCVGLFASNIA
jgi:hypothetical protein